MQINNIVIQNDAYYSCWFICTQFNFEKNILWGQSSTDINNKFTYVNISIKKDPYLFVMFD